MKSIRGLNREVKQGFGAQSLEETIFVVPKIIIYIRSYHKWKQGTCKGGNQSGAYLKGIVWRVGTTL